MKADVLLSRLRKVKKVGSHEWVACCSAHDDRTPSLAIKESDGMVLIHCFAGCEPLDVLRAVGLDFADIMPDRVGDHTPKTRQHFSPMAVLEAISNNALLVALMANEVAHGEPVTAEDKAKFFSLAEEIREAVKLCRS